MRPTYLVLGLLAAQVLGAFAATPVPTEGAASVSFDPPDSPAVVREARYRMSAAVRPLLVFWIRASDVGGARILWRKDDDGRRAYELLVGSDPRRAPRRINRWGWEREDLGPDGATLFGLMRKTDEESLEEARDGMRTEGNGGFVYKAIRTHIVDGRSHSENALWHLPRDYTYRDLGELQALARTRASVSPRVRQSEVPPGTEPGFLFAVAHMIDDAVGAALLPERPRRLISGVQTAFTFNATFYDLRLRSSRWLESATYGGRRYERLLRVDFETFNRDKRTRERFFLVCATDGPLARVPVFLEYQPKWWFKASGVLDDSEIFP
jgi:hypothetical protein